MATTRDGNRSGGQRSGRQPSGRPGGSGGKRSGGPVAKSSHIIEEHIDVGVPRQLVYDQWTNYDDVAKVMKRESAHRHSDRRVSFESKIGPSRRHWTAEVIEREPGRRIAWRSISGAQTLGVVTFHDVGRSGNLTRLMVEMEFHPSGVFETVGNFFRMPRRRVRKNLKLFKHHMELTNEASASGPGRIDGSGALGEEMDDRISGRTERARRSA